MSVAEDAKGDREGEGKRTNAHPSPTLLIIGWIVELPTAPSRHRTKLKLAVMAPPLPLRRSEEV